MSFKFRPKQYGLKYKLFWLDSDEIKNVDYELTGGKTREKVNNQKYFLSGGKQKFSVSTCEVASLDSNKGHDNFVETVFNSLTKNDLGKEHMFLSIHMEGVWWVNLIK